MKSPGSQRRGRQSEARRNLRNAPRRTKSYRISRSARNTTVWPCRCAGGSRFFRTWMSRTLFDVRRYFLAGAFGGGGGAGPLARRAAGASRFDLETQVELTLLEVASGMRKQSNLKSRIVVKNAAARRQTGSSPVVCPQCAARQDRPQGFGGISEW